MSEVYLGNPNLKKANTQIEFTEEQIIEFLKCKEDPVYFAKNYIKIVSLDHGLVPFEMYPFQEKLVKRKFPGLAKSFAAAYKELYDRDFFGIKDVDANKLNLI